MKSRQAGGESLRSAVDHIADGDVATRAWQLRMRIRARSGAPDSSAPSPAG